MGSDVGQIFPTASLHRDHSISYTLVCEKEFSHMGKISESIDLVLTLKAQRKNASEKGRQLKSSAANNCLTISTNLSTEANRGDPDQTALIGAV